MKAAVIEISFVLLSFALLFALIRLTRGPSLPDRVVALDLIAILAVGMIVLEGFAYRLPVLLDVAIVVALVAFAGTVAFAKYLERRIGPD